MSLKHLMLAMFAKQDMYGYELKLMYDYLLVINEALNLGQIYSTLSRMERDGLIVCANEQADKKTYRITENGRSELTRWIVDKDSFDTYPDNLSCKLAVCRLVDKELLLESVKKYRVTLIAKMQELIAAKKSLLPEQEGAGLVIERNIYRLEADINWLALCADRLQGEERTC